MNSDHIKQVRKMKIECRLVDHKSTTPFYFLKCDLGEDFSVQVILHDREDYGIFEFSKEGMVNKYEFLKRGKKGGK